MPIGLCEFLQCLNNTITNLVLVVWFMLKSQKFNYLGELEDIGLQVLIV